MKKLILIISFFSVSFGFYFHGDDSIPQSVDLIVSFITYNGYGNNLYIDNLMVGKKYQNDVAVISILNINKDTTFVTDTNSNAVIPKAVIFNAGKSNITIPFTVEMIVEEFGYSSIKQVQSLNSNLSTIVTFDTLHIDFGVPFISKVVSHLKDTNYTNDSLSQQSIYLIGAPKKVLVEEFTSATSPACAYQDPYLDFYHNNNINDLCVIKYHIGFPPPGNDSMYLKNPIEADYRKNYYYANSVPYTILNGIQRLQLPYAYDSILNANFSKARRYGSPVSINVIDSTINEDSVKTRVNLNILYKLRPATYKLRIAVVERRVQYVNPPGTNGIKTFYDVFRKFYPDTNGFVINNNQGNYQYEIKFRKEDYWNDSLIYTIAFLQEDFNREVINSGKSKIILLTDSYKMSQKISTKADVDFNVYKSPSVSNFKYFDNFIDTNSKYWYELFEYNFPPAGWTVKNSDRLLSFEEATPYNGISLGGIKCVRMPFYDYSNIGERDTLLTPTIYNVNIDDTLQFDYAYARYIGNFIDSLKVEISTDGGNTFKTIFNKGGNQLATSQSTTLSFGPSSIRDWKTFYYPIQSLFNNDFSKSKISFKLNQNYPNPFNPKTYISFQIYKESNIDLKIYDITGREVITLMSANMLPGDYTIEYNAEDLASGIYFIHMSSGKYSETQKMVYIK
ncbi:MAG: T9SS type A sorting domain-containing protein [Ignavibacteria bacterium]|nr:T9SS type A sorting domain-containing protein [Ignavibacteria bacterium]